MRFGSQVEAETGDAGAGSLAEHRQFVVGLARTLARGRVDPDDLAQDVLERWLRTQARRPPVANPRAWLTVVLRRLVIDRLRRQRASPEVSADWIAAVTSERDAAPWWTDLDPAAIDRELARLPPALRETFELFTFEARSYQQIAAQLNIAMGTVGVRISRARALLRRRLGERRATATVAADPTSDGHRVTRAALPAGSLMARGVRMGVRGSGCSAARELACG
jgi:RNA polymerase sigma-70 factor (ECF subfamily)